MKRKQAWEIILDRLELLLTCIPPRDAFFALDAWYLVFTELINLLYRIPLSKAENQKMLTRFHEFEKRMEEKLGLEPGTLMKKEGGQT